MATDSVIFEQYIRDLIDRRGLRVEGSYYHGITSVSRARQVRQAFRDAGRSLEVAVKAYWTECPGCAQGGPACRYHVHYTAYDLAEARAVRQARREAADAAFAAGLAAANGSPVAAARPRAPRARKTEEAALNYDIGKMSRQRGLFAKRETTYRQPGARSATPGSSRGFPDWVIVGPGGTLFREAKSADGTVSCYQAAWGDALQAAGNNYAVWRPADLASGRIAAELDAITPRPALAAGGSAVTS
jgi:hypothetical protein